MRTPEVTELLRQLKRGRLLPCADAYALAEEVERLEAELIKANERVAKVTRIMYSDHVEKMKELEAQNALLREALWFLLMGYEGLGGDMGNNAPVMAKAALAETKGTP